MTVAINLGEAIRRAKAETLAKNRKSRYRCYYYTHPEAMRERRRRYHFENQEEIREKNRVYYYRKKAERTHLIAPGAIRMEAGATA